MPIETAPFPGFPTDMQAQWMALMTLASGYLYAWLGVVSYYVMALVAFTGLGLVISAYYLQPQSVLSGGKTREAA